MSTIMGDVEGAALARDDTARPALRRPVASLLPRAPRPTDYRHATVHRILPSLEQDALFSLMCPDSRGPSVIVDAHSLVIHYANRDGLTLLLRNSPFQTAGGVLEVTSPSAGDRLRRALRATCSGGSKLVVVDGDYGAVAVRVSPFRPDPDRATSLAVADFSTERLQLSGEELSALADGFGLTDAEAAIAGLMADGLNLDAIAARRGVRRETVRNQCKTLLAKTHCHRQVDLVRMVLSLCARTAPPAQFQPK